MSLRSMWPLVSQQSSRAAYATARYLEANAIDLDALAARLNLPIEEMMMLALARAPRNEADLQQISEGFAVAADVLRPILLP